MLAHLTQWPDRKLQASSLAEIVASQLQWALMKRGKACLAVPGGTTPAPFLQALAVQRLAWQDVTVSLSDERQVPPTHERSNALLLQKNFLTNAPAHFISLFDPELSLTQINARLKEQLLPLDVCVLGMGADGHFASLFPQAKQLAEGLDVSQTAALLVMEADQVPEPRLSLSLAALLSATTMHLLITGTEKLAVWQQANERVKQGQLSLPIDYLMAQAGSKLTTHYAP